MTVFRGGSGVGRWLPSMAEVSMVRRAALGVAGLAFAGGALAGPAVAAEAAPVERPAAVAQSSQRDSAKEVRYEYRKQENYYYCGPAATRIALSSHGAAPSQAEVAKRLGTTEAGTNSAEDVTRVLNSGTDAGKRGGGKHSGYRTVSVAGPKASKADVDRLRTDVMTAVDADRAVVANIKGTAADVDGGRHSYEGGHYLTVVGYRDGGAQMKLADPYDPVGEYWVTAGGLADWVAERGYSA